jgi:hypothetical protein
MKRRLPALAAAALPLALLAAAPSPASAAYKECEFTKKRAKKHKAPRCARDLGKSKWIVVSGEWRQELTVSEQRDDASFTGTGQANLRAGGLSGATPFPSRKRPTVSMTSTTRAGGTVEYSASSQGGWTDRNRHYDCGFTAPESWAPNGFGGIFSLKGRKSVKVQWVMGGAGFRCDTPYGIPSPKFPITTSTYPLASFENRRLVKLPIAFAFDDDRADFSAHTTYDGVARLRRYR